MSVIAQVVAERDALKTRLNDLRQELRRIVAEAYGEHILEDLDSDEEVLGAIGNLCAMIEARDKVIASYREMFPCVVCGKPMNWEPNDNLGQALKAFVKEKRWGHSSCVNPQKR